MTPPKTAVQVNVDSANPGQFFACCGLLELADRICHGAEGWFEAEQFCIAASPSNDIVFDLPSLLKTISVAPLRQVDPEDDFASPIELGEPINLTLDWW